MSNKIFAHAWFLEPDIPVMPQLSSIQPPLGGVKEGDLFSVKLDDKDIKSIAKRLKNGETISEVEWIILLRSEERYQVLSAVERESIVIIVWANLIKDELRYNKCLIKIVAGLARGFNAIAYSLVTAFPKKITTYQKEDSKKKTDVVRSLLQQDYLRCGRVILGTNLPVNDWFKHYEFEAKGEHITSICNLAVDIISSSPGTDELSWWLSCQEPLVVEQTIHQLEKLLEKVTYVESGCDFDCWIQNSCLPDSEETLWYQLSEVAQNKLKSLYQVTSYKSVQKILDELCETSTDPTLHEVPAKNLKMRTTFWAAYSDSFERVRFLLTQRSKNLLSNKMDLAQERVTVMGIHPLNDASEICIVEIGRYVFIERFRGSDFDLGVFEKSSLLEKLLFESKGLDGAIIGQLTPDWIVDHKDYWQKRLIRFLSNKRIKPNKGNRLAKGWFTPLSRDDQHQVDSMKQRRYPNNLDISIYFKTGQRYR
jgi:hypothetical protein